MNENAIEGRNAVIEAFRAGKTIDRLYVQEGVKDGPVQTVLREAKKQIPCFLRSSMVRCRLVTFATGV